jgi:hypothetical protein
MSITFFPASVSAIAVLMHKVHEWILRQMAAGAAAFVPQRAPQHAPLARGRFTAPCAPVDCRSGFGLALSHPITLKLQHTSRLIVTNGQVWLTRSGDLHDHVLNVGECIELPCEGRWVAEALAPNTRFQLHRIVAR